MHVNIASPAGSRRCRHRYTSPLVMIVGLLGATPAFAYSPPSVWPFSNVFTVGASVDGGDRPFVYYDVFHRFAFLRDEDTWPPAIQVSPADGLGRHNFAVAVTQPGLRHAKVWGQTCWHELWNPWQVDCGDWSAPVSVTADELPGLSGELKGYDGNNSACADVSDFRTANGSPIGYWSCWGGANQKWNYTASHTLQGLVSKCASTWNFWIGEVVRLDDCGNYSQQRWTFTNATLHGLGGKCADAPNGITANATQAQMYDCNGSGAQLFNFVDGTSEIRGPAGQCLDVFSFGTNNGTPVVFWTCNGLDNQKWTVGQNGELRGWGGKCLEVAGFDVKNGAKLQMWDCHGGTNQKFWISGELRNFADMCLDIPMNSPMGTQLQVWQCWGGMNQRWQYTP
jgi:hypothetical protein